MAAEIFELESIKQLKSDLKRAKQALTKREARYLVDLYYTVQGHRMRLERQISTAKEAGEPHATLAWAKYQFQAAEQGIKGVLDAYSDTEYMGRWAKSIYGIGPVISAGLLAHVNMEHCTTAGKLWRFAGLDPTVKWLSRDKAARLAGEILGEAKQVTGEHLARAAALTNRKVDSIRRMCTDPETGRITVESFTAGLAKRPYNHRLRVLCWRIGQCFIKTCNRPESYYGQLYKRRKEYETVQNELGAYAEQAKRILATRRIGEDTVAYTYYSQGKLPPAHITARAARWVTKLFLSHYWEEAYRHHYGCEPSLPYPIAFLGHADKIAPPA